MRFKKVYIEISNVCNLHCRFCVQNQRPPRFMSIAEFTHIIQEIKPYTNYVYLHVLGEPFFHPQLPAFLKICDQAGMYVNMTTNGTLLKKRLPEIQMLPIRQLNISLHSYEAHHQKAYVEDIISSIEHLPNTYISYRLWCLKEGSIHDDDKTVLDKLAAYYAFDIDQMQWKPGVSFRLKDRVFLHFENVFAWPSLQDPWISETGSCLGFIEMCAILSDGRVIPCCLDSCGDIAFGDIFQQSFQDIIESEKTKQFYEHMKHHRLSEELCQKCSYRLRFHKE